MANFGRKWQLRPKVFITHKLQSLYYFICTLAATAGDKPFADVYKIDGLRGIYIASQIIDSANPSTLRSIHPKDLRSLITFDQGGIWTPIQGPKTDEQGRKFDDCAIPNYRYDFT